MNILNQLESEFVESDMFKDIYEPVSIKKLKTVAESPKKTTKKGEKKEPVRTDKERKNLNKNLVILCRNYKQYIDMLKFLYQFYFKKDNGLGFYDDRFRLHLNSHREVQKRTNAFDINNSLYNNEEQSKMKAPPKQDMNVPMVELHLLQKLNVLLEQKYFYHTQTDTKSQYDVGSKKRSKD